jgi:diguanylate cyclase (GGDEF)-like protein
MNLAAGILYWLIVAIWTCVLAFAVYSARRNLSVIGTTRILLLVVIVDTVRDIVENIYFGLYFGGQYGLFHHSLVTVLGDPLLLMSPKLLNVVAGCVVLFVLLIRWLPTSTAERSLLQRQAALDGLTEINNRAQFLRLAEGEWSRGARYHRVLAMIMLDIDHFKGVNDRFGHDAGDRVIVAVARVCGAMVRSSDILGRLGGEEFGILLPETDVDQAQQFGERLRDAVARTPILVGEHSLSVTVSVGVAAGDGATSLPDLMKRADRALYAAKEGGRDRVARFTPALPGGAV